MSMKMLCCALGATILSGLSAANAQGPVKVGISAVPGIFTAFDEKTGKASGAMVELFEAIASNAGIEIQYVKIDATSSDPFVAALKAGKIDTIVYTFQITPDRQSQFDFSNPVLSYGETLVVQKTDPTEYRSAEDLRGRSVGAVAGSNYVDLVKRAGGTPVLGNSVAAAVADVNAGKIVAAMGSAPTIIYVAQHGPYDNVKIASEYRSKDVLPAGMGVRKGDTELLKRINDGLAKFRADGTSHRILTKYGLE
jgi:polar amino acid transport system substrate-binding protein